MSHLNFNQFKAANQAITGGYYIWTDNETFEAYNPGVFSNDPYLIAPMQSFIVEKTGQISELQFNFTMSTTTSDITLRSSRRMEEATLKMDVLRNQVAQSHIRLKYGLSFRKKIRNRLFYIRYWMERRLLSVHWAIYRNPLNWVSVPMSKVS